MDYMEYKVNRTEIYTLIDTIAANKIDFDYGNFLKEHLTPLILDSKSEVIGKGFVRFDAYFYTKILHMEQNNVIHWFGIYVYFGANGLGNRTPTFNVFLHSYKLPDKPYGKEVEKIINNSYKRKVIEIMFGDEYNV